MKPIIDFVKKNLDLFSEAVLKTKSIFEFMENLNQMMKLNFDNFKKHWKFDKMFCSMSTVLSSFENLVKYSKFFVLKMLSYPDEIWQNLENLLSQAIMIFLSQSWSIPINPGLSQPFLSNPGVSQEILVSLGKFLSIPSNTSLSQAILDYPKQSWSIPRNPGLSLFF